MISGTAAADLERDGGGFLRGLEGEPAAEVAARLGITVNALRQVKFRVGRMIAAVEALYGE